MTLDEIKSKYCSDAVKKENVEAIKRAQEKYGSKVIALAKKINEADYNLKELEDLKRKEAKYKKEYADAVSEFKNIFASISDKDEKAEVKGIFKRWCKSSVKGL